MITTKQLTVPKIKKYLITKLGKQSLRYLDIHVKDASTNDRTFLIRTKPNLLGKHCHPFRLWVFNLFGEEGDGPCVPCGQMYMNGSSFGRQHTVSTIYTFRSKLVSDIKKVNAIITAILESNTLFYKNNKDIMDEHNYHNDIQNGHVKDIYYKKLAIASKTQIRTVLKVNKVHLYKIGNCSGKNPADLIRNAQMYKKCIRPMTNVLYDIHYDNHKHKYTGTCGIYYYGKTLDINSLV